MKLKHIFLVAAAGLAASLTMADDITTLDGKKYENVKDVTLKPNGLFFVAGTGESMKGVTVTYTNLSDEVKDKYHYDPFEPGLMRARQDQIIFLSTNMAFSLDQLEAAKTKAKAEKKLLGFILVWDSFFTHSRPMDPGSEGGLAHFFTAFHNNMVLVFVRHEDELDKIPDSVRTGFFGPEEGGFAPNMAVVTADCSQFICEIPLAARVPRAQFANQFSAKRLR